MTSAPFIFSLFLFFGLFSLAGASLLLIQFRKNRPLYVTYWALGALGISIGVIAIAFGANLPEWISYKFANGFTFTAAILFNYSLASLLGRNTPLKKGLFGSFILAIILIGLLVFVSNQYGPRYQPAVVAIATAVTSIYGFTLIYQYYKQSKLILAGVLSAIYLVGALVWSIRAVIVLFFNVGFAYEGGTANAISFVALLVLGILRFMFFAGLVIAIFDREKEKLTAELHLQKINVANQNTIKSEETLAHVLNVTGEGVWDWNILTGEVKHNSRWLEMLGEDPNQSYFSVEDFKNRIYPKDLDMVVDRLSAAVTSGEIYQAQYRMVRNDGGIIWVNDKGAIVERSDTGEPLRMVGAIGDVSVEKAAQEKIQELIFFDVLTKLPNRQYIQDRIVRTINESIRNKTYSGLMYLDLDNFKTVNDTYGHNVGDLLLKAFGARIQNAIRPKDIVARIGGDEYLILFEEIGSTVAGAQKVLEEAIERILEGLSEYFDLGNGIYVHAKASIGIVIFGEELNEIEDILKFADLAMYSAKGNPHNSYRFFDQDLMIEFGQKNEYLNQLKEACLNKELFAVYQPVVDRNQVVMGYEALARWHHPTRGLVEPDDFIPFAEKNGLIIEVGNSMINDVLSDKSLWDASIDQKPFNVFINISAHQLINLGFAKQFVQSCEKYNVPLNRIHLEITESVYLEDLDMAIEVMSFLHKRGTQFALDDFGTGFSSLTYLQKLPIQYLKIDKSFVAGLGVSTDNEAIAINILTLARGLDIKVIAEGVETQSQFDWLHSNGCDFFQGWYFGKPSRDIWQLA